MRFVVGCGILAYIGLALKDFALGNKGLLAWDLIMLIFLLYGFITWNSGPDNRSETPPNHLW